MCLVCLKILKQDLNALMYAAYHNHVGVAQVLIEYNCDMNTTDHVLAFNF